MTKKHVNPIPETFSSLEEAGEFWDDHDSTDYLDELQSVKINTSRGKRYIEIEIEMNVVQALRDRARQQGVSVSDLATQLIREQLAAA